MMEDRDRADTDVLRRAADWPEYQNCAALTETVLRQVTAEHGIDFATALLHDRLCRRSLEQQAFLEDLEAMAGGTGLASDFRVVVVPGAFYREYGHTGAGGEVVLEAARTLGCRAERVHIPSFDRLGKNARVLCDWLDQQHGEPIILVSLCKGAADVRTALGMTGAAAVFRNVRAWVSLSGLLGGTALVTWLRQRWLRWQMVRLLAWWRGYSMEALREIERGGTLAGDVRLPHWLPVIHVAGFPLRRHLSSGWARRGHERLAALGPNDGGGLMLADVLHWPGLVLPVWGADHYLRPAGQDMRALIVRVLRYIAGRMVPDSSRRPGQPDLQKERV